MIFLCIEIDVAEHLIAESRDNKRTIENTLVIRREDIRTGCRNVFHAACLKKKLLLCEAPEHSKHSQTCNRHLRQSQM